ncbi:MAG: hypothetical protein ABJG80_06025 [Paracoccaceae bacterium]
MLNISDADQAGIGSTRTNVRFGKPFNLRSFLGRVECPFRVQI